MKSLLAVGCLAVLSAVALAQHRGPAGRNAPPLLGPGYPAIGGALPIVNPFSGSVPFPQRLGATISGFPSFTGAPAGFGRRGQGRRRNAAYPLLYPVFGPIGDDYSQPGDMSGPPPAQQPNPPVVINQNFGPQTEPDQPAEDRPRIQSYSAPSASRPEPAEDQQPLFFIAITDNSVYTAVAYWVENGTLNYITPQGRHNQVSLSLIDRETTARLNRGSKFQLHLPGA